MLNDTHNSNDRTQSPMSIVIIGLTITSSWGNGHATTYRGLVYELAARGHEVLFLEHDKPWYANNRDLPAPPYGCTELYVSVEDLKERFTYAVKSADLVIVGSYVPQGVEVGNWVTNVATGVTAFYDIDTPVTLAKLQRGDYEYLSPELIPRYQLYLSFTGGPTLRRIEREYGSPRALPLYCSVDPTLYFPEVPSARNSVAATPASPLGIPSANGDTGGAATESNVPWDLGYLGTYSDDRQPILNELMVRPAQLNQQLHCVVAGPQYPATVDWPANVQRIEHLPPAEHRSFYNRQRFTLNATRSDMIAAGYSPSVRLFEAAACGVPIISDWWEGLDTLLIPDEEILIARTAADTLRYLTQIDERQRQAIGDRARKKILSAHTAAHRAAELERYAMEALDSLKQGSLV